MRHARHVRPASSLRVLQPVDCLPLSLSRPESSQPSSPLSTHLFPAPSSSRVVASCHRAGLDMELPSPLEPSGCPRRREIEATAPASTSLLQSSSPDVLMSWHCSTANYCCCCHCRCRCHRCQAYPLMSSSLCSRVTSHRLSSCLSSTLINARALCTFAGSPFSATLLFNSLRLD